MAEEENIGDEEIEQEDGEEGVGEVQELTSYDMMQQMGRLFYYENVANNVSYVYVKVVVGETMKVVEFGEDGLTMEIKFPAPADKVIQSAWGTRAGDTLFQDRVHSFTIPSPDGVLFDTSKTIRDKVTNLKGETFRTGTDQLMYTLLRICHKPKVVPVILNWAVHAVDSEASLGETALQEEADDDNGDD